MTSLPPPPDAAAREQAVAERARNVLVVAGAGSGKTSLLVERALDVLLARDARPEELAAITFTEAAAAEMRARLRTVLEEVAAGRPERQESRSLAARFARRGVGFEDLARRAQGLLPRLERASCTTIHGFCTQLLRRHPVEAGTALHARIDDGSRFRRYAEEAWEEALAALDPNDSQAAFVLARLDLGDLRAWFEGLLHPLVPARPDPAGEARDRAVEALVAMVDGFEERLRAIAGKLEPHRGKKTKFHEFVEALAADAEAAEREGPLRLRALRPERRDGTIPKATKGGTPEDEQFVRHARRALEAIREIDEEAVARAVALLAPHAAEARGRWLREGWLSYEGLLVHARDLLRDHREVRRAEGERFRAILVDEFQDTDPLQYEIVFLLAEDTASPPADDAAGVRLAPGRLFLVGDPKQSIYRFRGADIEAYRRAEARIADAGGLALGLDANFRSPAEVLGPLDRIFRDWLPSLGDDEIAARAGPDYRAMVASRGPARPEFGPAPRVELWTTLPEGEAKDSAGAARRREADWIAEHLVREIRERGRTPREFAILLRAFSDVGLYAGALQRLGVPYLLEGGRTFYRRAEVSDLLAWLRATVEPNDAVALLAALRSPSGGADDAELARHADSSARAGRRPFGTSAAPDPQSAPNVARAFETLRGLRAEAARRAPDELVRLVIERTRLEEIHAAGFDGAQRVANLRKCAELAVRLAREEGHTLDAIALELERRAEEEHDEGEGSLTEPGLDAVTILTIHKAKGLEFEVVFVPDLARKNLGGAPSSSLAWRSTFSALGAGLDAVAVNSAARTPLSVVRELREEAHRAAEGRRLLYVAATRAKERLVFVASKGGTRPDSEPWLARLRIATGGEIGTPEGTPDADGDLCLRTRDASAPPAPLARAAPVDLLPAAAAFVRQASAARGAARPPLASPSRHEEAPRRAERAEEWQAGRCTPDAARLVGTVVHALLERAVFAGSAPLATEEAILREATAACAESGADALAVAAEVRAMLASLAGGSLRARLARAGIVARELPVLCKLPLASAPLDSHQPPAGACSGIADLLFEESGSLVVADWKTDEVAAGAPLRAALERHRTQVSFYARAIAAAAGRPVRGEIFFVRLDRAFEV